MSLYFEIIDQLSKVLILKGRKVLLEKDHYHDIMKDFVDLNKDFLLFLCKDEAYGKIKNQMSDHGDELASYFKASDKGPDPHL